MNQIIPSLWFHSESTKALDVLTYYKTIFGDNLEYKDIISLGQTPSGNTEMVDVLIFGHAYSFMVTENLHQKFNDAFSLTLTCHGQEDIDKYWNYFTKEGKEIQCGWCEDKYGLKWQVIPDNLSDLMQFPKSFEIMMGQKKIIIAEYHE